MDYVVKLKFPGAQEFGCKKKNGEYKIVQCGGYTKEYIPEEKCLKFTIPNCEADYSKTNEAMHKLYMAMLNLVHKGGRSGNEYGLKGWISTAYSFYCCTIYKAGKGGGIATVWNGSEMGCLFHGFSNTSKTCSFDSTVILPEAGNSDVAES